MYNSIKSWLDVALKINPFIARDGAGDKQYDTPVDALCYPVYATVKVVNNEGTEVLSSTQLFVDGSASIKELDTVTLGGATLSIKRIDGFYRKGVVDIWVVYL